MFSPKFYPATIFSAAENGREVPCCQLSHVSPSSISNPALHPINPTTVNLTLSIINITVLWVVLSHGIIGHSSFQHLYQYRNWFLVNKSESLNFFSFGILENLCFSVFSASKRKLCRVIPRIVVLYMSDSKFPVNKLSKCWSLFGFIYGDKTVMTSASQELS